MTDASDTGNKSVMLCVYIKCSKCLKKLCCMICCFILLPAIIPIVVVSLLFFYCCCCCLFTTISLTPASQSVRQPASLSSFIYGMSAYDISRYVSSFVCLRFLSSHPLDDKCQWCVGLCVSLPQCGLLHEPLSH